MFSETTQSLAAVYNSDQHHQRASFVNGSALRSDISLTEAPPR
jgi:hypothetical protein